MLSETQGREVILPPNTQHPDRISTSKMADLSHKIEKSAGEKINIAEVDSRESTTIDEKQVIRKIDLHIIPIVTLLYLLSFIDRANIVSLYLSRRL
jgi:hypothetical protein